MLQILWQVPLLQASVLLQSPLVLGSTSGSFDTQAALFSIFKLLFVVSALLYVAFAFVVTRQIKVMRTTLITPFSPIIRVLGYVHFLLALIVFGLFIVIL